MVDLSFKALKSGEALLLITTNVWFTAKDGQLYKAVWGKCKIHTIKDALGFEPKAGANWFIQIGPGEDTMFIMGSQINYAQVCLSRPVGTNILCIY